MLAIARTIVRAVNDSFYLLTEFFEVIRRGSTSEFSVALHFQMPAKEVKAIYRGGYFSLLLAYLHFSFG